MTQHVPSVVPRNAVPDMRSDYRDVLVVVPARAGSRRLPRKNLAKAGGDYLLQWALGRVNAALGSPVETGWTGVVASDDAWFVGLARSRGIPHCVHLPTMLTGPRSTIEPALRYCLAVMEGNLKRKWKAVVLIEPCVPIAPWWLIRAATHAILDSPKWDAACAVEPTNAPHWCGAIDVSGTFIAGSGLWESRDNLPPTWVPSGGAWVYASESLMGDVFGRGRPQVFAVPHSAGEVVSVDTARDLMLADAILSRVNRANETATPQ